LFNIRILAFFEIAEAARAPPDDEGVDGSFSLDFTAKIADRCGIELHPASSSVVDHVHFDMLRSDDSLRNEVVAVPLSEGTVRRWLFEGVPVPSAPILYSGIGLTVKRRAHLAESVLSGHAATYSMDSGGGPMEKAIVSSGPSLSMAAALQTRANGRVTVIGSVRALSDEFWTSAVQSAADGVEHGRSGNEQFVTALSRWAFGERALLRVSRSEHRLAEPEGERVSESGSESVTVNPNRYRIKDSVRFSATIEQFDADCDCWRPFAADDVQFELVRLDAFVRGKMQQKHKDTQSLTHSLTD